MSLHVHQTGAVLRGGVTPITEEKRLLGVEGCEGRSPARQVIRELLAHIKNLEVFQNRIQELLKGRGASRMTFPILGYFLTGEPAVSTGDCTDQIPFIVFPPAPSWYFWSVFLDFPALFGLLLNHLSRKDLSGWPFANEFEVLNVGSDCIT